MTRLAVLVALASACSAPQDLDLSRVRPAADQVQARAGKSKKKKKHQKKKDKDKTAEVAKDAPSSDVEDVTAEMQAMNGDDYGAPPKTFSAGSVSTKTLDASALAKTDSGWSVKLPSGAPVTTPAVYDGRVYVSGGFRSQEFYAFEQKTGKLSWALSISDDGPSSPACAEGKCVFNTESCTIFTVDAKTGKQLWSWWLGDPLTSAPTIAGGRVFTGYPAASTADGKAKPTNATHALAAFDLDTGELDWTIWLDADVMSAPVASGDFLYVATFGGTIVKVEQATGKIRYAIRARATSAPVVVNAGKGDDEQMYYTRRADQPADPSSTTPQAAEEELIRMDDNDPKTKYTANKKKAEYLDHQVQAGSTYGAGSMDNDAANGFSAGAPAAAAPEVAAANVGQSNVSSMQAFQGSRVLHLDALNVSTMGDEVIATDVDDGSTKWSHKLDGDLAAQGGFLATPPLSAGDSVIVGTLDGSVLRLDQKSGEVAATWAVGAPIRSQPVVDDGWIFVGTEDGHLVAIDTGDTKLTGWPMMFADAARTGAP